MEYCLAYNSTLIITLSCNSVSATLRLCYFFFFLLQPLRINPHSPFHLLIVSSHSCFFCPKASIFYPFSFCPILHTHFAEEEQCLSVTVLGVSYTRQYRLYSYTGEYCTYRLLVTALIWLPLS